MVKKHVSFYENYLFLKENLDQIGLLVFTSSYMLRKKVRTIRHTSCTNAKPTDDQRETIQLCNLETQWSTSLNNHNDLAA
jgi:hypothetical protein